MKKFAVVFTLFISFTSVYAQQIKYQKAFYQAIDKGRDENKPVFIFITVPPQVRGSEESLKALKTKEAADFYNSNFVNYTVNVTDTASNLPRFFYNPTIYPAYIYLDSKGTLVYKTGGNINAKQCIEAAKTALSKMNGEHSIAYFKQLDANNKLNAAQLKEYIILKQELGQHDNADLVDKYVEFLPISALNDYQDVLFILQAGPIAYGKAYNLAHTNKKLIDSIYKTEPLAKRIEMNNRIIWNTRNRAISLKDANLAMQLSGFVRGTWTDNYREGEKSSTGEMINYYKAVKDTNNYYMQAQYYYDNYYMNISADSAKKLAATALLKMKSSMQVDTAFRQLKFAARPGKTVVKEEIRIIPYPANNAVANTLNNAAYDFYVMGTRNQNYLIKALIWSKRSIDLQPLSGYYDTLAHILYRLNFYDEALLNQHKALEMAEAEKVPAQRLNVLKAELTKMTARQL